jgi:Methyltransferase domain
MSIKGFLRTQYLRVLIAWRQRAILKQPGPREIERADWERSLREPTEFYLDCFRYFNQQLPAEAREHRAYFRKRRRGLNEDAMHVMWFLLFREFKPATFLEIGVYRGQTISLAALLSRMNGRACRVQGISPFTAAGDSVSRYRGNVDYLSDTLYNFDHFALPRPELLKAFSTATEATSLIRSMAWDMIYIDGNHDLDVVLQDWEVCSQSVRPGGVIVLDDASRETAFRPPLFATAGHPGPSQVAREVDSAKFSEILRVGHNRVFQRKPQTAE